MYSLKKFVLNLYTENRRWFRAVFKIFILSVLLGVIAFFIYPDLLNKIIEMFEDKFGPDPALDSNLAWDIFKNNIIATMLILAGGLIAGAGSMLFTLTNGFIIGYVLMSILALSPGGLVNTLLFLVVSLVPHGIFEIPAMLIAGALGMKLGLNWMQPQSRSARLQTFKQDAKTALYYIPFIILLLLIAAFVEVFVSGKLGA